MTFSSKLIGKRGRAVGDAIDANSEIVAAVEVSETTDQQKALDVIKRAIKASNKSHLVIVVRQ